MQLRIEAVTLRHEDVRRIYLDAFPKEERMPFPMMVAMSKLWNTQFLGFYDGDVLCGFAYLALDRELVFIMFLAVDRSLRSKGFGSAILEEVRRRSPGKKAIVSIELCDEDAPDIEIRKRRKAFYLRNGYGETGFLIKLGGVTQELLVANGAFVKKEFRAFFARYSNDVMWPKIWQGENKGIG